MGLNSCVLLPKSMLLSEHVVFANKRGKYWLVLTNTPVQLDEVNYMKPKRATVMRKKELLYNFGCCDIFCDNRAVPVPPWNVFRSDIDEEKLE